jgi:vitamin B12 transporter
MIRNYICGASLTALVFAAPAAAFAAEDTAEPTTVGDLVVTATLDASGVRRDLVGGSISVITADDLEQRGTRLVSDVLRDVPGVAVSRSGCAGCLTQIRLRGAEANHTLVLIDGINLANPVGREADLSSLLSEDGGRLEVLRGQQSALYGSEAIGGVIQYFTPDGRTSPGLRLRAEYGSFNTFNGTAQAGGVSGPLDYVMTLSGIDTEGTTNTRLGSRDLDYWNYTLSAKAHYAVSENVRLTVVGRASKNRSEFNSNTNAAGVLQDSPPDFGRARNLVGRVELQAATLGERWTHNLSVEGTDAKSASFSGSAFESRGDRVKGAYVTAITFGDEHIRHKLSASVDYRHEAFRQTFDPVRHTLNTTGVVGVYELILDNNTAFSASLRNDSNNRFEDFTSYRVQATHAFPTGTRVRAAAGTGIQYPNQFELFGFSGTFRANPNLSPEKSEGWEAGIEQKLGDGRGLIGATYFDSRLTDKISSTGFPISTPVNLTGKAHQKGVETFAEINLANGFAIDAAYTYLDSTDGVPAARTLRRARNIASLNVNWTSADDVTRVNLNIRHNGRQKDNAFLFTAPFVQPVVLSAFTVVNVNAEWKLNEAVTLYGRADNLFDETYEEVFSYVSPGRAVTFGIKARF